MCRPVPCQICGKTTWAGCGEHIEQVRAQVAPGQWCPGHPEAARPGRAGGSRFRRWLAALTAHG